MKLFVNFDILSDEDIGSIVEQIQKSFPSMQNLYVHWGTATFYQQSRRCRCGSHLFRSVDEILMVECTACKMRYHIQ